MRCSRRIFRRGAGSSRRCCSRSPSRCRRRISKWRWSFWCAITTLCACASAGRRVGGGGGGRRGAPRPGRRGGAGGGGGGGGVGAAGGRFGGGGGGGSWRAPR